MVRENSENSSGDNDGLASDVHHWNVKVFDDEGERETIRGLTETQKITLLEICDREEIRATAMAYTGDGKFIHGLSETVNPTRDVYDRFQNGQLYLVIAMHYDYSQVQGAYPTKSLAEEAIEKSSSSYNYYIKNLEINHEPQEHTPYF